MRRYISSVALSSAVVLLPLVTFAQNVTAANPQQGLFGLVGFFNSLLNAIIVLLITAAVVAIFYWGVRLLMASGDAESRKAALEGMMYGVIALAVMVSIWGLVKFLQSTLGISNSTAAQAPSVLNIK
ncbi:MAG: hypothetical protein JWO50_544 [Candidatus Kaiserbacteria bacterium]|nr:hypothetical protein [Candidatus Kaiserbacteria bacterium]